MIQAIVIFGLLFLYAWFEKRKADKEILDYHMRRFIFRHQTHLERMMDEGTSASSAIMALLLLDRLSARFRGKPEPWLVKHVREKGLKWRRK